MARIQKYNSPRRLAELEFRAQRRKEKLALTKNRFYREHAEMMRVVRAEKVKVKKIFKITEITPTMRQAIDLMMDFNHSWPMEYIANQCGICVRKLHRWRRDPYFIQELNKELDKRKTMIKLEAFRHIFRHVKKGNTRMIRDYMKMTGDLKDKGDLTINVNPVDTMPEKQLDQEIQRLSSELGAGMD